jgi:hypothetical protein
MENYKGNSNVSKENLEKKRIEPITQQVTVKKESELKKFKQQFFSEDVKSVRGHIFMNVIIPGIQRLLSDTVKNGIDWFIYGVKGTSSQSGMRNVSYSNYYDKMRSGGTPTIPNSAYNKPNIYSINDVSFRDRGEAEEVLLRMREVIDKYGMASIADFYDMISQKHTFTDNKYGWRDLKDTEVIRVRDGYSIQFPKIIPLE